MAQSHLNLWCKLIKLYPWLPSGHHPRMGWGYYFPGPQGVIHSLSLNVCSPGSRGLSLCSILRSPRLTRSASSNWNELLHAFASGVPLEYSSRIQYSWTTLPVQLSSARLTSLSYHWGQVSAYQCYASSFDAAYESLRVPDWGSASLDSSPPPQFDRQAHRILLRRRLDSTGNEFSRPYL